MVNIQTHQNILLTTTVPSNLEPANSTTVKIFFKKHHCLKIFLFILYAMFTRQCSAFLILLTSAVWATSLVVRDEATPAEPTYITRCEAADNCETFTNSKGNLKPRFK